MVDRERLMQRGAVLLMMGLKGTDEEVSYALSELTPEADGKHLRNCERAAEALVKLVKDICQ